MYKEKKAYPWLATTHSVDPSANLILPFNLEVL